MTGRYNRHNLIDWFSQEALSRTKVAVVGAGAVGNEVIKNLALLGTGEIHIFDFDRIEEHNLTRSVLFRDADIGQPKANVAARRAMDMDRNLAATPIHGDFWDNLTIAELRTFDAVFCCVDNFEARIRCNTLCYLAQVDFINLGIDSRSASVELFPFSQTAKAGCLECILPETVYRRISERYSCGHLRKLSFMEKKVPTTIITSSTAASLAVSAGLRLGAGVESSLTAKRLYVDTIAGSLTHTVLGQNAQCPCCSRIGNPPVLVTTKRDVDALPPEVSLDATVMTSEPILVGYRIVGQGYEHLIFKRASDFNDSFPPSLVDEPGTVELEVRDQFSVMEIAQRFAGRMMPCKFAIVTTKNGSIVCEFEEEDHE